MEIRETLSIVCEGTLTEPNYFFAFSKKINAEFGYERINVSPKPPALTQQEQQEVENENRIREQDGTARGGRRRRQIQQVQNEPETPLIPNDFVAQPLRYVWEAKENLKIHNESWAVYDLDQHTHHRQAFELAQSDDQKVHIAFSSISFETWILLHFEYNNTPFEKSQCRTGDDYHLCGQGGIHVNDCKGNLCTTGHLKINNYIESNANVKSTCFTSLESQTEIAINNALLLRNSHSNPIDFIEYNPITTVDRLVFKLLYISDDYKWISASDFPQKGLSYKVIDVNKWEFSFKNNTTQTFILHPTHFQLCNIQNFKSPIFVRKVMTPGEEISVEIDLNNCDCSQPKYLIIDNQNSTFNIVEIQSLT